MPRLLISFGLALLAHIYLLQFQVNLADTAFPELISDDSVSVTLNHYVREKSVKKVEPTHQKEFDSQPQPVSPQQKQAKNDEPASPAPPAAPKNNSPEIIQKTHRKVKRQAAASAQPAQSTSPPLTQEKDERQDRVEKSATVSQGQTAPSAENLPMSAPVTPEPETEAASVIEARPHYQYNPKPKYPKIARRRGWEGTVMLQVRVDGKGSVTTVALYKSCGYKILDKSALRTVKRWRFIAGSIGGKATPSTVIVPVHFKLRK